MRIRLGQGGLDELRAMTRSELERFQDIARKTAIIGDPEGRTQIILVLDGGNAIALAQELDGMLRADIVAASTIEVWTTRLLAFSTVLDRAETFLMAYMGRYARMPLPSFPPSVHREDGFVPGSDVEPPAEEGLLWGGLAAAGLVGGALLLG